MKCFLFNSKFDDERFWNRIKFCDHDQPCKTCCAEWLGSRDQRNYGRLKRTLRNGKVIAHAHRVAWIMHNQMVIPNKLEVAHICDNPPCCNPYHLTLMTHRQNMDDCKNKGRRKINNKIGSMVKISKLTEAKALEVWRLWVEEGWDQRQIAEHFGTSQVAIHLLLSGQTWKHVPCPYPKWMYQQKIRRRKLTKTQASEIVEALKDNICDYETLAQEYGVSVAHIKSIDSGHRWKNVG